VYKISCNDCDATYVGQTKRKLNIWILEHRNQINRKSSKTVITEHRLRHSHDFDWLNVKILDSKRFYWKRIISENQYKYNYKITCLITKWTLNIYKRHTH